MDSLNTQIIFRNKYNIDDNELTLLEILLIAQEEEDNELVKLYFTSTKNIRTNLIALKDAGVILKSYKIPEKGEHLDIYAIPINKNVTKDFYKSSFDMGKELFDTYPQFPTINNNGPNIAKKPPTAIITFCIAGLRLLNQVNTLVIPSTKF